MKRRCKIFVAGLVALNAALGSGGCGRSSTTSSLDCVVELMKSRDPMNFAISEGNSGTWFSNADSVDDERTRTARHVFEDFASLMEVAENVGETPEPSSYQYKVTVQYGSSPARFLITDSEDVWFQKHLYRTSSTASVFNTDRLSKLVTHRVTIINH